MSFRERTRLGREVLTDACQSASEIKPRRDGAGVRLITRHGNDFTHRSHPPVDRHKHGGLYPQGAFPNSFFKT